MTIHYTINPVHPDAHLFEVTLSVSELTPVSGNDASADEGLTLELPNWIPGSYMIRDFSRNIVRIEAFSNEQAMALEKLGKSTWRLPAECTDFCVRYQVYAWELSVRAAHLDRSHGFFNGTSVFLQLRGRDHEPVTVAIEAPTHPECQDWNVATAMQGVELDDNGFGLYRAESYDELIDHPVEMGTFERIEFLAAGVPHEIVLTGAGLCDHERLAADLKRICEYQIDFFGGTAPMERYLFLVMVVGSGYGGLEHRASTALLVTREHLPGPGLEKIDDRYLEFLGLCSHEYFHTWNVKRIKPARFVPYQLEAESPTRLLWFFEGVTSYYDDLFLVRCGLIDTKQYLNMLIKTLTRVHRGAGRHLQSVTDSSFDAWHKFYKQDENAPNAIVSYYAKGALVALCLDVELRRSTDGRQSLDDLMQLLWSNWCETQSGLSETEPEVLASQLAGTDLSQFFTAALYSTEELPLVQALAYHGLDLKWLPRKSPSDTGAVLASEECSGDEQVPAAKPWLGATLTENHGVVKISQVMADSPAQAAGLAGGDVLIAIERQSLTVSMADRLLQRHQFSEDVSVHYFRLGRLYETKLPISKANLDTASLCITNQDLAERWTSHA